MKKTAILSTSVLVLLLAASHAEVPAKVTFNDHVLPIFKNACLNCHNPDKKKAGLDLSTYSATLGGSDNGKVVESGNAGASLLFKCVKQTEEPKMPPKGDKLTDNDLAIVEKWIAGQLLETANSKGVTASNNVQLAVVSLDRPDGPPPMPGDLPLEPFVRAQKTNALVALASSPWAPLVAIGGQKQVLLYNTETLQPLGVLPFPEGFPAIVRFSRNGQLLLTGGGLGGKSGQVVLWDIQTGERAGVVGNEFDQVLGADISPDHAHVALGGPSKVLKIYSTKDGKLEHSIKKHTDWITAVAFSPDGKYLASADRNGGISVWEGTTGNEFNALPGHKTMVTALAFMPGVLASAGQDGTVVLWDIKEGKEIRKWNAHKDGVEWVDFTPDGRLVTCGRDRLAKAWDATGKNLFTSAEFGDIALRAALNNDRVVAGDWSGTIRVFKLSDPKGIGEITANPPPLAEQLAAAEKRLETAKAAIAPLQQAVVAEEEKLRTQQTAPTAEEPPKQHTAEPSEKDKKIAELTKKLEQQNTEVTQLRAERAKQAEGSPEYAAANEKVQAKKAQIAETQATLESAQKAVPPPVSAPTKEQALAKAKTALEQAQAELAAATSDLERWHRAQSYMRVHNARQTLADKKARYEELVATAKDALAPVDKLKVDIAAAEKMITEAPARIQEKEHLLADTQAAVEPLNKAIGTAEAAVMEKDAAAKSVTELLAKVSSEITELPKAIEAKEKQLADTQTQLEKLNVEIAKRREERAKIQQGTAEYTTADAKVQEVKPRIAESTAKLDALKADASSSKAALEAAKAKENELKPQLEVAKAEVTKAQEALGKARADVKSALDRVTKAERDVAAAKKAAEDATKQIAELRKKLPEVTIAAELAKATAEKQSAALANELESAKAQAEQAKAEFESRYRPAQPQSAATAQTNGPDGKS